MVHPAMIVQHKAVRACFAFNFLRLAQPGEAFGPQQRRCLDLNAEDPAKAVFQHDINFLALSGPGMRQTIDFIAPRHQFQHFRDVERIQQRSEPICSIFLPNDDVSSP